MTVTTFMRPDNKVICRFYELEDGSYTWTSQEPDTEQEATVFEGIKEREARFIMGILTDQAWNEIPASDGQEPPQDASGQAAGIGKPPAAQAF